MAGRTLKQWQDTQQFSIIPASGGHLVQHPVRWEKPKKWGKKVNVDATIFSESGTTGLGWVLRNLARTFLAVRGELVQQHL